MRRLLPLVLSLAAAVPVVIAAEDVAPPANLQGVTATVSKRANVRYGPSTNARIACTLDVGDSVEIIGPAEVPDWFVVRFPQKAQAWVDAKNLEPMNGGKNWRVTREGTNARDDATLKGNIVAELAKGEVIDDRNAARGNWHAVYIPSAVAYVHKSLVSTPNPQALQQQADLRKKEDATWEQALAQYRQIYQQVQDDDPKKAAEKAARVDWAPVQALFDEVAKDHPDSALRSKASQFRDRIADVVEKAAAARDAKGEKPVASNTTGGAGTAGTTAPKSTDSEQFHTVANPDDQKPLNVPEGTGVATTSGQKPGPAPLPTPAAPAATIVATGFVSENSDYPKVGAPNLLLDGNSNVVAFLKPKDGASVNLAEYYWRWVGVSGEKQELDPATHGLGKQIPLIVVDAVQLVKK